MKVTVTKKQGKEVVTETRDGNGYIRLEQKVITSELNKDKGTSITRIENRSALLFGKKSELESLGYKEGDEITGKIIVLESLIPFNKSNPERDYKIAGSSGVVCMYDGKPIYRRNIFTTDLESSDVLIQHNNQNEIKKLKSSDVENTDDDMELEHEYIDPDFNFDDDE